MDRYHYANSEPPQLSLLDVPQPVLEGGLADMHPRPLVARTKRPGEAFTSFRVPANRAWEWDEVEYARTPTSYTALVVDLDGEGSRNRVCGAVLAKAVQTPSWIVERPSSGGVHAVWALQTPVHRYPHAKRSPLDYLARIGDFYNEELDGDRGYTGVLAHNPESPTYETEYFAGSWSLEELAQFIPLGWRRPPPRKLETPIGRNTALYRALQRFAGKGFHMGNRKGLDDIEREATRLNVQFPVALPRDEVHDIVRSVDRSMKTWAAQGHRPTFLARQGTRGSCPEKGVIRRSADPTVTNEAARPWEAEGVSRRTWYRHRATKSRRTTSIGRNAPLGGPRGIARHVVPATRMMRQNLALIQCS